MKISKKGVDKLKKTWYNKTIARQKIKLKGKCEMTRKQSEMVNTRNEIIEQLASGMIEGFEVVGIIPDGVLLKNANGYAVIKPIVKKGNYDPADDLQAIEDRRIREEEKTKAKAEKVAKAQAKA